MKGYKLVYLVGKPTHQDTVSCQLTHIAWAQFPHLSCNAVLLHQRLLDTKGTYVSHICFISCAVRVGLKWSDTDFGEVELKGVVSGQRDHEASGQILWQRVAVVTEEQTVVTQRRHGNADLSQVVQVLKHRGLKSRRSSCELNFSTTVRTELVSLSRNLWEIFNLSATTSSSSKT